MLWWKITKIEEGRTLWKFLLKVCVDVPLSKLQKIFRQKQIKVNDQKNVSKNYLLKEGDVVKVYQLTVLSTKAKDNLAKIDFEIIYQDQNILIVNKKTNFVIHGHQNSLDQQVLQYLKEYQTNSFVPSHIGRLDKQVSGIVVYAKNYLALAELKKKINFFEKVYQFKSDLNFAIKTTFKLKEDPNLKRQVVCQEGKETLTYFWQKDQKNFAQIVTGRKHQIRASLAHLGFPIWGDQKYQGPKAKRLYLHAYKLTFSHLEEPLEYLNGQYFISDPKWE